MTAILGISAFYHDSAAAVVVDGRIVAAAQEERFSHVKHDAGFPTRAVEYCLREAGLAPHEVDYVGFYDKPLQKFGRLLETYLAYAPRGFGSFLKAMPVWLNEKLYTRREIRKGLGGNLRNQLVFTEHHESHAASAFFPSPFDEAAILTIDGVGEWATAACAYGRGNRITLTRELRFPHSLGLLYSAFTYYCGFAVNSGEYKLMGLAPYGEPTYADLIRQRLIDLKDDGSFRVDLSFFNYCEGLTMTSDKFSGLFGASPRAPDGPLTRHYMDVAASIQKVTEEIVLRMARSIHAETGLRNLCLAGGVALNCVANGRLHDEGPFGDIWVQPAAGDAGGALGVALFIWHQLLQNERRSQPGDSQFGSLLGPEYSADQIQAFLDSASTPYARTEDDEQLCERVADAIAEGKVVGWFQGRMEYGPRALGSRSILGDARNPQMQAIINQKVKFREGFRPFAPAVLREDAAHYFNVKPGEDSPYMLRVAPVAEKHRRPLGPEEHGVHGLDRLSLRRSELPAITHVDNSARIQTVDGARHGLYRRLIETFKRKTGCPVIINTSFNLGWDPIVCTPQDAYRTFMSSGIDVLCMGPFVLEKREQRTYVPAEARNDPEVVLRDLWRSPCCDAALSRSTGDREQLACAQCGHRFVIRDNIPELFWPHEGFDGIDDVTKTVKSFYERNPFPNYDEHDSLRSLVDKSRRGLYADMLNKAIPYDSSVLEVGCGTGQLSNFLGIASRRVVGTDLCMNSLRLAEKFRSHHNLSRVRFVHMNLFRPCFEHGRFDVILCNGVLHHTNDPYGGFRSLVPLLKPGGRIVIGLYNRYGRLATDLRRAFFHLTGGRGRWLDSQLRHTPQDSPKHKAWYFDQYRHPHESKHTIAEVLRWFDEAGLGFVRGIPSVTSESTPLDGGDLFRPTSAGSTGTHCLSQLRQVFTGAKEGGFFLMIGQRPADVEAHASRALDCKSMKAGDLLWRAGHSDTAVARA